MKKLDKIFHSLGSVVVERKLVIIFVILLISVFMVLQAPRIRADFSNEAYFKDNDPEILKYNEMKETFGNDEFVYILFRVEEFFRPEVIEKIRKFQEEIISIKHKGQYVIDEVESLVNATHIEGRDGQLIVSELIGKQPTAGELKEARQKALGDEMFLNHFISKDDKYVGILVTIADVEDDGEFRKVITRELRRIFKKPEYNEFDFHAVGIPIYDHDSDEITGRESVIYLGVSFIIIAIILYWLFRSFRVMLGPLLDVLLSTFFTYSLMGTFGMPVTLLTIPIPLIIMTIGVADSIHIISKYYAKYPRYNDKKATLQQVFKETGFPCLFTTITTMLAFLVLTISEIKPIQHLGIVCSIGVFFSYLLSVTLVPIMLPRIHEQKIAARSRLLDRMLLKVGEINSRRKVPILIVSLLVLIFSVFGLTRLEIDTNFTTDFRESSVLVRDYNFIDRYMGGSLSLEMMLSRIDGQDVRDPQFLEEVEKIIRYVESRQDIVVKAFSINHLLKRIHKELNDGDPRYYRIPGSADAVKQELFLYGMSEPDTLSRVLDFENKKINITVRTRNQSSGKYTEFVKDVEQFIRSNTTKVKFVMTGGLSQIMRMAEYVSKGQVTSYSVAFILICAAMMLIFVSLKIGLISMIPNVLPVAVALGFMGIFDMALDFFTLLVACIMIGIIVDDSIHIISEYRRKYTESRDYGTAGKESIRDVGRAVFSTSLALGLAFFATVFSESRGVAQFGLLCAITIFSALLFDLFLTPTLIELFKPFGGAKKTE